MTLSTNTKRLPITLLLAAILLSSVSGLVSASERSHHRSAEPLDAYEVWLDESEYQMFNWSNCREGGLLFGSLRVINGTDVDFFICNSTVHDAFVGGDEVTFSYQRNDVESLNYSFVIPSDGTWYIGVENDDSFTRVCVKGTINYSPPSSMSDLAALPYMLVITGVTVLAVIGIKVRSHSGHQ